MLRPRNAARQYLAAMQPLILLHGALGASRDFSALAETLRPSLDVYALDFAGHAGAPDTDRPFDLRDFADVVIGYMDAHGIAQADIFGYSMGGYVGMIAARNAPKRVRRVATLATKFHWDPDIAAREVAMLNPEVIEAKVPKYAAALADKHAPIDWKMLVRKTGALLTSLGDAPPLKLPEYATIQQPCLVALGDRDKMVTLEETLAVYKSLPAARLAILPGTPHPLEAVPTDLLAFHLKSFFEEAVNA